MEFLDMDFNSNRVDGRILKRFAMLGWIETDDWIETDGYILYILEIQIIMHGIFSSFVMK